MCYSQLMEQIEWQKFMDRAIKECDLKTVGLLERIPPPVAAVMLIQIGKSLCRDDDWKTLSKQMKPTWREKLGWTFNSLQQRVRNANTNGS